jgi:hypothetical protein
VGSVTGIGPGVSLEEMDFGLLMDSKAGFGPVKGSGPDMGGCQSPRVSLEATLAAATAGSFPYERSVSSSLTLPDSIDGHPSSPCPLRFGPSPRSRTVGFGSVLETVRFWIPMGLPQL